MTDPDPLPSLATINLPAASLLLKIHRIEQKENKVTELDRE